MKALLIGHVPPARTENKMSWDESCWQKYTLWMRQYRDVIAGQVFGHMNINHFMFQDFEDIDKDISRGIAEQSASGETSPNPGDDELSIASATDYLIDLRNEWAKLPSISTSEKSNSKKPPKHGKIGGPWAERYSLTHVGSSVVPNYFPTLRVFEYNITGLDEALETTVPMGNEYPPPNQVPLFSRRSAGRDLFRLPDESKGQDGDVESQGNEEASKKKKHKFVVPDPPSKSSPPGPAYSPQKLSLVGYTHYLANLTYINNDFTRTDEDEGKDLGDQKWKEGKHKGKNPKHEHGKPQPNEFKFQVEYSTFEDKVFRLKDLTVLSYLDLARRIGDSSVSKKEVEHDTQESNGLHEGKNKGKKKKNKEKKKGKRRSKEWFTFVRRAFVETVDPETIEADFGSV
jgi:endopolyphosphatase